MFFFVKYGGPSGGSLLSGGGIIILCVIRRHFLACEDIASGSELSAAVTFFREIHRPFRWVPDVKWRNHYFARSKEAFPCVRPWSQLSASPRTVHFRCMSVVDHADRHAESTRAVDDGEAYEGNDMEAGKTRPLFLFPTRRGVRLYEGLLVRLPSAENNSRSGSVEGWLGQRWEYGGAVRPAR